MNRASKQRDSTRTERRSFHRIERDNPNILLEEILVALNKLIKLLGGR